MIPNLAQNLVAYFMKQQFELHIVAQNDFLLKQIEILKKQVKKMVLSNCERVQLAELGKKLKDSMKTFSNSPIKSLNLKLFWNGIANTLLKNLIIVIKRRNVED